MRMKEDEDKRVKVCSKAKWVIVTSSHLCLRCWDDTHLFPRALHIKIKDYKGTQREAGHGVFDSVKCERNIKSESKKCNSGVA